jgi:hypothetical protein
MTFKQRLFVAHYLGVSAGNATDAARRAGYRWPNKVGERLVGKSGIRDAIDAKLAGLVMSQDEILLRLGEIAAADVLDFVAGSGGADVRVNLKRARRQGKGFLLRRLRAKGGDLDIELESKLAALVKLGEYYGMWNREPAPAVSLAELAKKLKERADEAALS